MSGYCEFCDAELSEADRRVDDLLDVIERAHQEHGMRPLWMCDDEACRKAAELREVP